MTLTHNTLTPKHSPELPAADILKIQEVAAYLRISTAQGYALVRRGVIPSIKVGKQPRVRRTDLLRWIDEQSQ